MKRGGEEKKGVPGKGWEFHKKEMNILLIDEFFLQRRILRNLLQQAGYSRILEVEDGSTALERVAQEKIDLSILSWYRSSSSPAQLLKTLGLRRERRGVPLFVVLGPGEEGNFPKTLRRRVSRFLIKPFSAEVLAGEIQQVLAAAEERKNHFQLRGAGPPGEEPRPETE